MSRKRGGKRKKPEDKAEPQGEVKAKGRSMLMNVVDPEEVRVALIGERGLEEIYIERSGSGFVHGNIYKGKVVNIEPTLQAAFVDIGSEKNGFLHVSDVVRPYGGYEDVLKKRKRKPPQDTARPKIEEMLHKGQELLVQITREQLGNKGPSLTTFISIPGRYLVLMPAVPKRGVSRKITDEEERRELKKTLDELNPPGKLGYIIRTAGMGRGKEELEGDIDYLARLWDAIIEQTPKLKSPAPVYQESDLATRAIRDYFYDDVTELVIDREEDYTRACEFLKMVMPGYEKRARLYTEATPLFHRFGIDKEIENVFARQVPLPGGGSIVIEQTEAMVTIDVNTGSFRKGDSTRETILAINLEAAREISRQLRLRDLGGLVMIDFIDMKPAEDRRKVENLMRELLSSDRARKTILPISTLGVMEMTRQRVRLSLKRSMFAVCPTCGGSGLRKNPEVMALDFVRRLRVAFEEKKANLVARLHPDMALAVNNIKRAAISALEAETGHGVAILADSALRVDEILIDSAPV